MLIIDEFTGRMMPGRRYSEGLHQALEAKERQPIQPENQTLGWVTFQNYFRIDEKRAREAVWPLREACKPRGPPALVGTTSIEKSEQLAEMLRQKGWEHHDFSDPNAFALLYSGDEGASKKKVFAILNARYHEQEAYIVAQAGVPGAITIATNMAGRGT